MTRAEKIEEAARALLDKWFEAEPDAEIDAMRAALRLPNDQPTAEEWTAAVAGATKNAEKAVDLALHYEEAWRAALAVLREIEWEGNHTVIGPPDSRTVAHECPACGGRKPEGESDAWAGHFEDCKLAAALEGTSQLTFSGGVLSVGDKVIGPVADVKVRFHDPE